MKKALVVLLLPLLLLLPACASKPKNVVGLDKYPQCYNVNPKISQACVEKNDAGESVTAVQLENAAYPGQYK